MAAKKSPGPKKKPAAKKAAAKKKASPTRATAKKKALAKKPTPKKAVAKKKAPAREPAPKRDAPPVLVDDAIAAVDELEADRQAAGRTEETVETPAAKPRRKVTFAPRRADGTITVALSPDADDAFMFFALITGKVDTEDRKYEFAREEVQALNEKAKEGLYDVTAISVAAYPDLVDRYLILSCGASFGDGQGPVLVARTPIRTSEVNGLTVAVPGMSTTAALALRLWLPHAKLKLVPFPFDQVVSAVQAGKARAGVLIHERQLTWQADHFVRVVDFGQWWSEKTEGLPLPLGANAIRRDIEDEQRLKIQLDIKRSIAYALGHREESLDYSMQFAKGLDRALVDRYVDRYVNDLTLDYGERGRQAVFHLFQEAKRFSLLPPDAEADFA